MSDFPSAGASPGAVADFLRRSEYVDAVLAAQCGGLTAVSCLCDPDMLELARVLLSRFSESQRRNLLRMVCGCKVPAGTTPTVTPTNNGGGQIIPANNPVTPDATASCPQGLPPSNSYT